MTRPYVISLEAIVRSRILVYADDLDHAHANMHELEDQYFADMFKHAAENPEDAATEETMDVRSAYYSEVAGGPNHPGLEVGTITYPSSPAFHTEDEKQFLAYLEQDEDDGSC